MPTEQPKIPLKTINDLKAAPDEHAIMEITGPQGKGDVIKCYHLDVNGCVVKPVNFKDCATAVQELGMFWLADNQPPKIRSKNYDPRD
jgi:DNA-binding NarL/FixJ family response regulator